MAKKASKPKKAKKSTPKPRKPSPRASRLPGMEDAAIEALEKVAADYADIRDERMSLSTQEHKLKERALVLMKQHNKTVYKHAGIEIRVIAGEEDVKVKARKETDGDDGEE